MAGISPIAWATVKTALHGWLAGQLGLQVDWARQDAPALPYPYGLLDIIAGPTRVHNDRRMCVSAGSGVKEVVVGDRLVTLSVDVIVSFEGQAWDHDTDALARATLAQASLERAEVIDAFDAAGIGVLDIGPVQDRRTPVEAGWISRAGFDVSILLVSLIDPGTVAPAIETVEIGAELGTPADWTELDFGLRSLAVRFYGEQRITVPAGTVIATPGTFLPLAGTYAVEDLLGFDAPASGRLRYVESEARRHKVSVAGALTSSLASNVKLGVSKNGAPPSKWTEVKASADRVGVSFEDLVELSQNDYLEAWVTADAAVTVTAQTLSLIAIA